MIMKKSLPILLILAIITILMINFFKRPSKELKFTKEFFILLSKNVSDLELVSLKDLEIRTKHKERELTHYLDNAYSEYLRNENEKEEILDRYIASTLDLYKPKDKFNLDRIVPVIKDSRYINELKRLGNSDDI